jgi:hypothetical protein
MPATTAVTLTSTPPTSDVLHGPKNDAADFYGLLLALVLIVASIAAVRVFFRNRR